jgi:hypothetical protein
MVGLFLKMGLLAQRDNRIRTGRLLLGSAVMQHA